MSPLLSPQTRWRSWSLDSRCAVGSQASVAAQLWQAPLCCRRTGTSPQNFFAKAPEYLIRLQQIQTSFILWACALAPAQIQLGTLHRSARSFPSGRNFYEHSRKIEGVDVITKDMFPKTRFRCLMRLYLRDTDFMIPRVQDARIPNNISFQHLVRFFAWAV